MWKNASASMDYTIKIWDLNINTYKNITKCLFTMTGHTNMVCSLVQLNHSRIIIGSGDKTIKIWG